ncbi:hypothetical protein GCM10010249_44860 [Streptomyces roseolilacinus]|uniref:Uncharacterized protein n=1 Tax=Streptomyces roseolilacinus TaxID=66904 RepID=A0A918B300_9ACTN|nr:hypothetical protein [Streptomyces roseolilacinus]GGQ21224.1 hypothetical protein GCM10010249_44860 [Streptomyces roseolilacinus]
MTNNLAALPTALYVEIDDGIGGTRRLGRPPQPADSEPLRPAVAQAPLGFTSEPRWLRFVDSRSGETFPYAPEQPGWNERLRAASSLVEKTVRLPAADPDFRFDDHAPATAPRPAGNRSARTRRPRA